MVGRRYEWLILLLRMGTWSRRIHVLKFAVQKPRIKNGHLLIALAYFCDARRLVYLKLRIISESDGIPLWDKFMANESYYLDLLKHRSVRIISTVPIPYSFLLQLLFYREQWISDWPTAREAEMVKYHIIIFSNELHNDEMSLKVNLKNLDLFERWKSKHFTNGLHECEIIGALH